MARPQKQLQHQQRKIPDIIAIKQRNSEILVSTKNKRMRGRETKDFGRTLWTILFSSHDGPKTSVRRGHNQLGISTLTIAT